VGTILRWSLQVQAVVTLFPAWLVYYLRVTEDLSMFSEELSK
jgi:hypothetical protein